ncbi:DUF1269 domain-containing protein [Microlunatus ginsengisoli]|uniref:DUF1269 domain-containing protein n=1 Tax=Microlunatus ginsengisoli TaxID=363863 RepID=A0ABP7ASV8_9ACTN
MTMITIFAYPSGGAERAADRLSWLPMSASAIDDLAVVEWPDDENRPSAWQSTPVGGERRSLTGAFWGLLFGHLFLLPITEGSRAESDSAFSGAAQEPLAHLGRGADRLEAIRDRVVPGSGAVFVLHADDQADKVATAIGRRRRRVVTVELSPSQSTQLYTGFGVFSTAAAG